MNETRQPDEHEDQETTGLTASSDRQVRDAAMRGESEVPNEVDGESSGEAHRQDGPADESVSMRDVRPLAPDVERDTPYSPEELTAFANGVADTLQELGKRIVILGNTASAINQNQIDLARQLGEIRQVMKQTIPAATALLDPKRRIVSPAEAAGNGRQRKVKATIP